MDRIGDEMRGAMLGGITRAAYVAAEGDDRTANNTVRHAYRVLTEGEKASMLAVKDAGAALIAAIASLRPGRTASIATTKAEEAVMWAVKGITE